MRVLMLGWEFPPHQAGGLATATHGLVRGLLARGLAITLVVPFAATGTSLEGLRVVSTAGPRTLFRKVRVPSPLLPYARPGEYTRTLARTFPGTGPSGIYGRDLFAEVERFAAAVAQIAAREPHDVIDAHDWMTYAAGLLARRASGRPLVAHVHATEFDRSGESVNPAIEARERLGMEVADLVIANSFRLKRQVVDRYGVPQRKVAVVHWGIDEDRPEYHLTPPAPFRPRSPLVLFLGRVTRQKGPDHFLAAARRVAQILPETRFVIAGSGDLLPGLLERSVEWGIADRVHFAGGLDGPDVYRALRMADLCVMPSVSEPFGLVALESLKSGTPCLIPRDSGVAEVVRHAIRIEFWDVEDMADKIVAVLRHTELHTELREAALAETGAPAFGLDEPARRTEEAYRRALAWSPTGTLG